MIRRLPLLLLAAALPALVPAGPATAGPDDRPTCAAYHDRPAGMPWQTRRLAPQRAWPTSRGRGVIVAVLDSGTNGDHPQLAGRVLPGTDLVRGRGTADTDCNGHGSIVGGIIAAHDSTDTWFSGVAPDATLLPVRIADDTARFEHGSARIAHAIRYAVDHHASVVNLSVTTEDSGELRAAVRYAHEHDVLLVAAAGNGNHDDAPTWPAAYPDVIAVSGIDRRGAHVESANHGDWVDLAAPGAEIVGPAAVGDGYAQGDGTSFAAPFVSGTAALVRAYRPELTTAQVTRRLEATADQPADGRDDLVGYGVVNPYRALTAVLGPADRAAPAAGGLPASGRLPAAARPTAAGSGNTAALSLAGGAAVLVV
ncbi:MAG: type VII secretion-associated serine protease mycosin, partial [Actinocatenispora sp.]